MFALSRELEGDASDFQQRYERFEAISGEPVPVYLPLRTGVIGWIDRLRERERLVAVLSCYCTAS